MPSSVSPSPWDAEEVDVAWLAGLLEGEGTFFPGPPSNPRAPVTAVVMVDHDVIFRVAHLMGVSAVTVAPRKAEWSTAYAVRVRGARAVAWMNRLLPMLGLRRQAQVRRALACYAPKGRTILTEGKDRQALAMLAAGLPVKRVAERFGVSVWCIYDLRSGRTHRHLARPAQASGRP